MGFETNDQCDLILPPSDTGQSALLVVSLGAAAIQDLNGSWGSPATANRFNNGNPGQVAVGGSVYFSIVNDGANAAYIRFRPRALPTTVAPAAGTSAANGLPIAAGGRIDLWVPWGLSFLDYFGTAGSLKLWASSRAT